MRDRAKLVIVGAGIVGCSAAYHLTKMGWDDILVLDKGPLYETGGSTSHAPGLVFQTNGSRTMCKMAQYTVDLFKNLVFEGEPAWYPVGSIEVAITDARMKDLWRRHGFATSYDLESHIISPPEVQEMIPILDPNAIKGGYYVPSDGDARAWMAAGALAEKAIATGGAAFHGGVEVTDIELKNGRVVAVKTDAGRIECEELLLCTNIWGPVLAEKIGLALPMMAVEHQYTISEPLAELAADKGTFIRHPVLRHQDYSMYFRQHGDAYGVGSYKHDPKLVSAFDIGKNAMRPFTASDFTEAQRATDELLPPLAGKKRVTEFNGMFVFTVDAGPLLGPTFIDGLWSAIGVWVTHGGGAGKAIAEWMTQGYAEWDMREADINRFHDHQFTKHYIQMCSAQQYREVYDIIHPLQQMEHTRNMRIAPFHNRLSEQKGHFHHVAGWEVAHWYEENARLLEDYDDQVPSRDGWEAMNWSRIQGAEHLAVRDRVGLFNLANFFKIEVTGKGSLSFLNYLAANNVDRPVGRVVYTALLNENGGIMSDLTVTRLDENRFWILTGAGGGPQDLAWIRRNAPRDGSVQIRDFSSEYTTVGLWGPKARQVLEKVCEDDVSNKAFPYFTARPLRITTVPTYALRVSYAGELGWEVYCPSEHGLKLWDVLWEAGQEFGLVAAGAGAFGSLRLEKGYRAWGADIHTEYNPFEAGLGWAVQMVKGEFIGRDALKEIKRKGVKRALCCMLLDDEAAICLGKEPVLSMSGEKLGYVTSADYGYSVGKYIAYGYLPIEHADIGNQVRVQYFDKSYTATVVDEPLFDPGMKRLKS